MLKNILSLLLSKFYSKEESELVGHQAMPSTQNVALTPTTTSIDDWGAVYNGVAPTDGFACIRFTADSVYCIASAQTAKINVFTTPQVAGDILLCACPVAKGQVFTLCARQAKNIECWFTKTIGGGQPLKSFILQGGGLCLNSLSSSLRRSSWLARRSGSEVKVFSQTQIPEQRSLLTTLRLSFYTPPSDGWITFGGNRPSVNVGITGKLGTCCVNSQGHLRITTPVRKGNTVSLYCETDDQQPLEAKFVPSEGAA